MGGWENNYFLYFLFFQTAGENSALHIKIICNFRVIGLFVSIIVFIFY